MLEPGEDLDHRARRDAGARRRGGFGREIRPQGVSIASEFTIWYEDIIAHPWATLAKILLGSPLKPSELDKRLSAALAADSQVGTVLAQARVAGNSGDNDFLDRFEAEWETAQPREVMERLGVRI